jgi:hypothetical protein
MHVPYCFHRSGSRCDSNCTTNVSLFRTSFLGCRFRLDRGPIVHDPDFGVLSRSAVIRPQPIARLDAEVRRNLK